MDLPSRGSITGWLEQLKAGNEAAAQELWNRYFAQLVPLARRRLQGMGRERDEEDVALSALKSAMLGVQNNQFPDLHDRTGLWPLLVAITARKAINEVKRQRTKKRDRGAEQQVADVKLFVGAEPTPEFALQVVDEMEGLVARLGDEILRTIVRLKFQDETNEAIARKLDVSTRTVVRKLRRIRQEWEAGSAI
jgi:DNA-directed RNA polymerase specialized sigma24 family protein